MKITAFIALFIVVSALSAGAQLLTTNVGPGGFGTGGGGASGGCSNSLDFSQACNSQYLPNV